MSSALASYPQKPVVGVGVVVLRGLRGCEEVLLIKRAKEPRRGQWSLPGGRQKLGEKLEEAARREVREETGVELKDLILLDVIDSITKDDQGGIRYHYSLIDFAANWATGVPTAGGDAADASWFPCDDLAPLELWDETLRVIELARQRLNQAP